MKVNTYIRIKMIKKLLLHIITFKNNFITLTFENRVEVTEQSAEAREFYRGVSVVIVASSIEQVTDLVLYWSCYTLRLNVSDSGLFLKKNPGG